ncbi:MAG: hypothetical protein KatS3mg042_0811 [Rhodothermaceae bacterium]|nr:MAG: hypothetical protein KatS3mg042_0811 [Rhodothermaceae bacterium]
MPGPFSRAPLLNPDYRDILSAFGDEKVEYLLVEAYALAVHGRPRATGDIDLWIRRSEENARKVLRALTTFGVPVSGLSEADLTTPDMVFQIGVAPRRIDILTSISGVEFDEAWEAREEVAIEGLRIPVISRQHRFRTSDR